MRYFKERHVAPSPREENLENRNTCLDAALEEEMVLQQLKVRAPKKIPKSHASPGESVHLRSWPLSFVITQQATVNTDFSPCIPTVATLAQAANSSHLDKCHGLPLDVLSDTPACISVRVPRGNIRQSERGTEAAWKETAH